MLACQRGAFGRGQARIVIGHCLRNIVVKGWQRIDEQGAGQTACLID
jgi:hypothetical protein